jgi:predicted nucleic acid-binding Zn ribbon protein
MNDFRPEPARLGDVLNKIAGRLKKVDLRLIDEIRTLWPTLVDPALGEHCRPEFIKNGVLIVSVPSGAFAQRVTQDSPSIILGFSVLGERAPSQLRTVISTQ